MITNYTWVSPFKVEKIVEIIKIINANFDRSR